MNKSLTIQVFGKVQGVGFRFYTFQQARDLGITGWVRNEADGSVAIAALGDEQALEKFLLWCKHGPRSAVVQKMEVKEEHNLVNYSGFSIE